MSFLTAIWSVSTRRYAAPKPSALRFATSRICANIMRAWHANLEMRRDEIIAATDERTYRIWKIYMAGSASNFWRGQMGLIQTLLAKTEGGGPAKIPASRRDLYA